MLRIVAEPRFTAEVKVAMPTLAGPQEQTFTAEFRALPVSAVPADDEWSPERMTAFLTEVLVGWDGVVDADDRPVAFSEEARRQIVDVVALRMPIFAAYTRGVTGAARGN